MAKPNKTDPLGGIFKAASDPTRRAILTLLAQHGPLRITDIHAHYDLSLNAISRHIKVLEHAGLVTRHTAWREHKIALQTTPLSTVDDWLAALRSIPGAVP